MGVTLPAGLDSALPETELLVWPENVKAVRLFFALATQWRWLGLAGLGAAVIQRTGLDYSVVPVVAQGLGIKLDSRLWGDIQTMEAAALRQFAQSR